MPDFFLDEFLDSAYAKVSDGGAPAAASAQSETGGGKIDKVRWKILWIHQIATLLFQVFESISPLLGDEIVSKTKAIFQFEVTGDESGRWFIDLKNGGGSIGKGEPATKADAIFTMKDVDFVKLFQGKLKPTSAFMTGKLKIAGDMGKAMKLEKLMGQMKSKL